MRLDVQPSFKTIDRKVSISYPIHVLFSFHSFYLDGDDDDDEQKPQAKRRLDVAEELRKRRELREKELELRAQELKLAKKKQEGEAEERKMLIAFLMSQKERKRKF